MNKDNNIVLYQDENGITNVNVLFAGEDLWLTQNQIAEIYDTTQPNVSMHIDGILGDGELSFAATHKKFLSEFQAAQEQPMTMAEWIASLDHQILGVRRKVLQGAGSISHYAPCTIFSPPSNY